MPRCVFITMPISFRLWRTIFPCMSSPVMDTRCAEAPVRIAVSHTLRPTPPKVCLRPPGVEVWRTEGKVAFLTAVAVMSRATPPTTKICKLNVSWSVNGGRGWHEDLHCRGTWAWEKGWFELDSVCDTEKMPAKSNETTSFVWHEKRDTTYHQRWQREMHPWLYYPF